MWALDITFDANSTHRRMRVFDTRTDSLDYNFDFSPVETAALRKRTYEDLSKDDLRRMALWKLDRVVEVPESTIQKLRALTEEHPLSARSPDAVETLEELVQCQGVSYPMASTFLKFVRPDVFPIIDVRAYRALTGTKIRPYQYTTSIYLDYVDQLTQISRSRGVALAAIDEQLYCFDKQHNGKI